MDTAFAPSQRRNRNISEREVVSHRDRARKRDATRSRRDLRRNNISGAQRAARLDDDRSLILRLPVEANHRR